MKPEKLKFADASEKICADIALKTVKEGGGYLTYDQYDEAIGKKYLPSPWIVGWGSPASLEHNNGVLSARKAVDLGFLINTGNGYKVAQQVGGEDE